MTPSIASSPAVSPVRAEISALWKLAWPIQVGQLATVGMGVADVAMTGHVSARELAAVSLGSAVWIIILVTVMGVMMAVNSVVAHEIGAGRHARVGHVVRQALWKGLAVGLASALATYASTFLFDLIGLEAGLKAQASRFLQVIALGMPAFAMYRALYGYTTSINQTKPVMLIALGGLLFNIFVNWLLVYGNWGMPQLGAVGCAVGTAIGMWLMLVALIWWIRAAPAYRDSAPFSRWEGPHWPEIAGMLRLGLPIGVTHFVEVSSFAAISLLVARFGVVQVSAHQIALNFTSLTFMVPLSFGIALITRVGQALGEGDPRRARFVAWVGVNVSLAYGALSGLFILAFRWQIARAYTFDPAVQNMAAQLLLFAAFFQMADATQVATASAIRGYKVMRQPMLIQLLAFWVFSLPLGCILGLAPAWFAWSPQAPMGVFGFWIGLVLGLLIAAVLLSWSLRRLALSRLHSLE